MPKRRYAIVKRDLLQWARETAGFSVDTAAHKIGVKSAHLRAWEADESKPTVVQLRKAAQVYKRPVAAFFLLRPPEAPRLLHDFRLMAGEAAAPSSPELILEMRRAGRRRMVAMQLFRELDEEPPRFSLRTQMGDDPDEVAQESRELLGISLQEQARWATDYEILSGWTAALEAANVLVFHARRIALTEMRGFSISEPVLPVVALNSKDAPRGRVFTLIHEFVHVVLQNGGICDPLSVRAQVHSLDERVEVFCNRVAGACSGAR